jgi:hypothetical protein
MLLGALIGQKILNPFLAITLAILSHYFLDFFPHIEYSIKNIAEKNWKNANKDVLKALFDFFSGILLIFIFANPQTGNQNLIYTCAFFAILPDALSIINLNFENTFLKSHSDFHQRKIHFLKNKKFSNFWRIFSQAVVVLICLILFKI